MKSTVKYAVDILTSDVGLEITSVPSTLRMVCIRQMIQRTRMSHTHHV